MHTVLHAFAAHPHALEGAFFGAGRLLRPRRGAKSHGVPESESLAMQGANGGMLVPSLQHDSSSTREYWERASLPYAEPYFRVEKCARIVTELAGGRPCDVLDVGCGPATLASLLPGSIRYFGIDLAIHEPADNLIECDLRTSPLRFREMTFDIVVAAGLFEYLGHAQDRVLREIRDILNPGGTFVVTYTNFEQIFHRVPSVRAYDVGRYDNEQSLAEFRRKVQHYFVVDRWFPSSHNLSTREPTFRPSTAIQLPLQRRIPVLSRLFAVNCFFICRAA